MCIGSYLWYVFALHQHRYTLCLGLVPLTIWDWTGSDGRVQRGGPVHPGGAVQSGRLRQPGGVQPGGLGKRGGVQRAGHRQQRGVQRERFTQPRSASTQPRLGGPGRGPLVPGRHAQVNMSRQMSQMPELGTQQLFLRQLVTSSNTCKKEKPSGPNVYSSKASSNNCLVVILYFFALSRQCPALRNSMVEDNLAACQHTQVGM